ncbi:MAG TPA: sugar ABC transporter substrate-binding protein [Tepidisphaeraceae bacterium]|jgi:ribose transport system substrate-binding protein|nr:sugar ABC transporter substrate-binding protein [Tepidisphaeraceae bacterium]
MLLLRPRVLIGCLVVSLSFIGAIGCDGGKSAAPASTQASSTSTKYKVGFANITEDIPFAVRVREGIERAAKENNVELVIMNNRMDGQTALSNADSMIVQGVQGMIEFQTDEQFGKAIMDKFNAEKIPVIAIDIPMEGATFFGVNNSLAGEMAGKGLGNWIKKNWNGQVDALIMLELPQSGPVPAARLKGQRDGLESVVGKIDESKVKHLDSKNTLEEANRLVKDALSTLPDAHHIAVVCINDDTALGAIGAAESQGRKKDIAVVAVDGSDRGREEIRKPGTPMVGTTASFPEKYGDKLIPAIIKRIKGEQIPDKFYTDHVFLTRENIDQYYPAAK